MSYRSNKLGKSTLAPVRSTSASQPAVSSAPPPVPTDNVNYTAEHANEVSAGAAKSAAEGIAKTANNAATLTMTGASPVVDIAGDLAANAHAASADVTHDSLIVDGPVAHGRRMVAGVRASLGPVSASASVGAPRRDARWAMWIVGGLAVGGLIYVMTQPGRRSRRTEE